MRTTAAPLSPKRLLPRAGVLALLLTALGSAQASASVSMCDVPIQMSDGVVLRANVFLPDDKGARVPVVLTTKVRFWSPLR